MRCFVFLCVSMFLIAGLHGQSEFLKAVDDARVLDQVENQIFELNSLLENSTDTISPQDLGYCIYSLCYRIYNVNNLFTQKEKNAKLIELCQRGIDLYDSIDNKGKEYSRLTGYLGEVLFERGELFEAFKVFNSFGDHDLDSWQACEAMTKCKILQSNFYRGNGDNEASIKLMDYLIEHRMIKSISAEDKARIYFEKSIALGMNYDTLSLQKSIENANIAYQLDPFYMKGSVDFQLGRIAIQNNEFHEAIIHFNNSVSFFIEGEIEIRDTLEGVKAYNNIGHCNIELGNLDLAIEALIKGQDLILSKKGFIDIKTRLIENILSSAISNNDDLLQKEYISKGIDVLKNGSVSDNISTILKNTIAKSYYYRYLRSKNKDFLLDAMNYSNMASENLDEYLSRLKTKKGLFRSKEEFLDVYKLGIDIGFDLNDHEFIFKNSEKSNNFLLYQIMTGENPIDISEDLNIERRMFESPDSVFILKLKIDSLYNNYLSNYSKPKSFNLVDVPALSKVLNKYNDKTMKSYCSGREFLYSIVLKDGYSEVNKIGKLDAISLTATQLRDSIIEIKEVGFLIESLISSLKINISDVPDVIITGSELSIIPHELLYKAENVKLSYAPSVSVIDRMSKSINNRISRSLIVTPEYDISISDSSSYSQFGNGLFYNLPYAEEEGNLIAQMVLGKNQRSVSKESFLSELSKVDLMHYSGHAVLSGDESMSYLALSTQKNKNIYSYQIESNGCEAPLVVLSACNTNVGTKIKGEGIMSLTRSFVAAGAKSVISTLWYVDDQSSFTIVTNFYRYLRKGQTKSQALANAKKTFLNNCPDYQKHPYYWAGIVLTGDNSPLEFRKPVNWRLIAIISSLVLIGFLGFRIFKKKKSQ